MKLLSFCLLIVLISCERNSYQRIEHILQSTLTDSNETIDFIESKFNKLGYQSKPTDTKLNFTKVGTDSNTVFILTASLKNKYDVSSLLEIAHFFSKIKLTTSLRFLVFSDSLSSLDLVKTITIIHLRNLEHLNKKEGLLVEGSETHSSFEAILKTLGSQVKYQVQQKKLGNDIFTGYKNESERIPTLVFTIDNKSKPSEKIRIKGIVSISKFIARFISAIDREKSLK